MKNIEIFLLIFTRIIAFLIIIPVLSGSSIISWGKLAFSASAAFLTAASGIIQSAAYYNTAAGFVLLIIQEFLTGFVAGFVIYLAFSIVLLTGQLLDFQIGFAMVNVLDPMTQIQVPIIGNLFFLTLGVMLVQSGGLHALLSALFFSYEILPIGGAAIIGNPVLTKIILELMTKYMVLAVQIALPMTGAILVIDVAMGLLVKAVPQMNVFVVGMPFKLLAGLILLYIIAPILINVYNTIFSLAYIAVKGVIKAMVGL